MLYRASRYAISTSIATTVISATIVALANDPNAKPLRIVGQAHWLTDIPVLVRKVDVGDVIGPSDIEWISVRETRAQRNIATAEDDLLGMSPRRPVKVGVAIRLSDVAAPVTVAKGAIVTMTVDAGRMQLTAAGRAMELGATNDVIRVANIKAGASCWQKSSVPIASRSQRHKDC